ncbi:MAG: hypothetical protein AAF902_13900, partial [Chloroflexota bacterium]
MEQIFVIDALASNWPIINNQVAQMNDPELELAVKATLDQIIKSNSEKERMNAIYDLLDLLDGTPVGDYVNDLFQRNFISEEIRERKHLGVSANESVTVDLNKQVPKAVNALEVSSKLSDNSDGSKPIPVYFATNRQAV